MATDLVMIKNNQVVVSSRQVADKFHKLHKNVLAAIKDILAAEKSATKFFKETHYLNRGKKYIEYLMNRDGFVLLVMGFTGKIAMELKIAYINAFNEMEAILKERQKPKQMPLIEMPKTEYVRPSINYEYMKKYAAVQAYLTVANDMFKDLTTSRTLAEHEGVLKTAVEVFSRLAWTCHGLQDIKLETYPAIK